MSDNRVYQPDRVIVGHCPECRRVVVIHNDHEVWPWVDCECGAGFDTQGIANHMRFEYGGIVQKEAAVRWRGRGASDDDSRGPTPESTNDYSSAIFRDERQVVINEPQREQEST